MPDKNSSIAGLAQELQRQVYQLDRVLRLVDQKSVSMHGTTVAQTFALLSLPADGSMTMFELSTAMSLAGSTMTRVVDKLVANGLAERAPDEEDRRVVRVTLTQSGRELRMQMKAVYDELFTRVAERIDAQEREAFLRSMRQMTEALAVAAECC